MSKKSNKSLKGHYILKESNIIAPSTALSLRSKIQRSEVHKFNDLLNWFYLFYCLNWMVLTEPIEQIEPIKPMELIKPAFNP